MKKVTINNQHQRYLFLADEVVFQVLHPTITAENQADIRGRIKDAIDGFLRPTPSLETNNWRYRLEPPNEDLLRITSFQPPIEPPTDTEPPSQPPDQPPDNEPPPLTLSFALSQPPTQSQETKPFSLIPIKLVNRSDPESLAPDDMLILLNDIYTEL